MIAPIGLAPSDDVAFVLQWATVAGLFGSALAARRRIRNPEADVTLLPILWAVSVASLLAIYVVLRR